MMSPSSRVLEFPAMLHGPTAAIFRKTRTGGQSWAREYLKTGGFTQPRRMRQVPPGEVLFVHSGVAFDQTHPSWHVYLFAGVFMHLNDGVPKEERQRMEEAFESFCLGTPWGALYQAVSPHPLRSAERMARRLDALLRFWDVLLGPRYAFWSFDQQDTLEELVMDIYGKTLEAWCPNGSVPVREHLALTVARMARATRQQCEEAVLRVIPDLVAGNQQLKHREVLGDPGFQRERLAALSPKDFDDVSSAYKYAVNGLVYAWDRQLGQQ